MYVVWYVRKPIPAAHVEIFCTKVYKQAKFGPFLGQTLDGASWDSVEQTNKRISLWKKKALAATVNERRNGRAHLKPRGENAVEGWLLLWPLLLLRLSPPPQISLIK